MVSRRGLAIDGVLLLDKPAGLSSNHALQRARRILNARKAGHTGTLDPFATGLMVLCFGEATKYSAGMFDADKSYLATVQLGEETDTGDNTGLVIGGDPEQARKWMSDPASWEPVFDEFRGPIQQIPPMYSALKRDGKPLYAYARAGIELEREPRSVIIHGLELREHDPHTCRLVLEVTCSKGTYIRTLAQDIGRKAGAGAHLLALRRLTTAGFSLEQALNLEQLEALADPATALLPVESLLQSEPAVMLTAALAERFSLGQTVPAPETELDPESDLRVRVHAPDQRFLGTACLRGKWLKPDRLMAFNKEF